MDEATLIDRARKFRQTYAETEWARKYPLDFDAFAAAFAQSIQAEARQRLTPEQLAAIRAAEERAEAAEQQLAEARAEGRADAFNHLWRVYNNESKACLGTEYAEWASGLQRAVTILDGEIVRAKRAAEAQEKL